MRLRCNGTELSESFNKVVRAISSKINSPILEGIKMMAYGNELKLIATDTELTIENSIHADIMEEGECLVKGRFTADLSTVMANQTMEIVADDRNISFSYADSEINVKLMNINEYPPIVDIDGDLNFSVKAKDFKYLIGKTIFSVGKEESRPVLRGCLFQILGDELRFVALDGFRLAIACKNAGSIGDKKDVIIPTKTLMELSKILDDEEIIKIKIDSKRIVVDNGLTRVTSRLINGEYIEYNNIIPTQYSTIVTAVRSQMLDVLTRVSMIAKQNKNKLVKMNFKENSLTMSSESEIGNISETVVVNTQGNDLEIGFNYKYIHECVEACESEYIKLSMNLSNNPLVIENAEEGNKNLFLVLPIRVTG